MTVEEITKLAQTTKRFQTLLHSFKGETGVTSTRKRSRCCRCGGTGLYSPYHGRCYRCGGCGVDPTNYDTVYSGTPTAEFEVYVEKCNEALATRRANKKAKETAKANAWEAEMKAVPVLKEALECRASLSSITNDILGSVIRYRSFSDKQLAAIEKGVKYAKERTAKAEAVKAKNADSDYQGSVGERITVTVKVEKIMSFDSQWGTSDMFLMRDAGSNVYKWMTSSCVDMGEGSEVTLTGTVKKHDDYRGTKQTVLTRCKVK